MSAPYNPNKPMDGLTRRNFLRASGVIGGAALLAGGAGSGIYEVLRRGDSDGTNPSTTGAGTPILVLVTLYGGNDGLNMLVPYADSAYHSARPDLAYSPDQVLRLDDAFGLNPKMTTFGEQWNSKRLAIVRGVGYPRPDHSHFRSMDIWQTASPEHPLNTGWLGRWLDAKKGDPLLAINLGETLPPLAVGATRTAAALVPNGTQKMPSFASDLSAAYALSDPADTPTMRAAVEAYAALTQCSATFDKVGSASTTEDERDDTATATGGNASSIGAQLALVSRCIRAGVPTMAYTVSQGGFDSHTNERGAHEALLGELDAAVGAFLKSLAGTPRENDVVVMIYSEFGRRVAANASEGTDHGTASSVLLLGSRVTPGFHGDQPSLTDLADGDLKATTDFRSIYAEVAEKLLGVEAGQVLPSVKPQLGVLR